MPNDQFVKAFEYMQIIKSQEKLSAFESVSYPKMSDRNRKELFKRVRNIAIPNELNTQPIHSTKEAEAKLKRILGNG
jgi:hypothetical protein